MFEYNWLHVYLSYQECSLLKEQHLVSVNDVSEVGKGRL